MGILLLLATLAITQNPQDILHAHVDPNVNPGVDFFQYANGGWFSKNPIPASESRWGIVSLVRNEIDEKLRLISEHAARANASVGSDVQKVGDFWATAMDEAREEKAGLDPLKPDLERIDAATDLDGIVSSSLNLQRYGFDPFFTLYVNQDEKRSGMMAVHLRQGGLGLPSRDYYFNSGSAFDGFRKGYVSYLTKLLELVGDKDAPAEALNVMNFETALAGFSRKLEDLRDPMRNYNKVPVNDLSGRFGPAIDWPAQLRSLSLRPSYVIVGQPEFFTKLNGLLTSTPVRTLQDYLRVHLLGVFAPYLNKKAQAIDFAFYHEILLGQKEQQPRWKRVMKAEDNAIGFLLGRLYVKQNFPPAAKKRYKDLVRTIRSAFAQRIRRLDWMSAATKANALKKLAAIKEMVGYPDVWKDYSALKIGRSSFCENMMAADRWEFEDMLSKFGKPVDHREWQMTPQTFDAYYDVSNNQIVLPAGGFVVPGLPDSQIDDAFAFGYAIIGHELTHGFDDQGRHFDSNGNLAEWWTPADAAKFDRRAKALVDQFNKYEPLPGMHVNGSATLGENIADYGGILIDLDAFKTSKAYKAGKKIGGLTPLQRFFLGWNLGWMEEQREPQLRRQLLTDVHAPAKWRVNGPFSNIPEFYRAFHIKPGQPMWRSPSQRVHIW